MGPLRNVQKVNSFPRSLISVRDLVEQYGGVWFDAAGVHVVTLEEGSALKTLKSSGANVTRIGEPTTARLYSFDIAQLEEHQRKSRR